MNRRWSLRRSRPQTDLRASEDEDPPSEEALIQILGELFDASPSRRPLPDARTDEGCKALALPPRLDLSTGGLAGMQATGLATGAATLDNSSAASATPVSTRRDKWDGDTAR